MSDKMAAVVCRLWASDESERLVAFGQIPPGVTKAEAEHHEAWLRRERGMLVAVIQQFGYGCSDGEIIWGSGNRLIGRRISA